MWEIDGPHNRINHLINPDEEDSKKQAPVKKGLEELSQSLLELVEFLKKDFFKAFILEPLKEKVKEFQELDQIESK